MPSICPRDVPTLDAALDACAGMWVNVEIKNDPDEPDFDPTGLDRRSKRSPPCSDRGEDDRWLISSFRIDDGRPLPIARAGTFARRGWSRCPTTSSPRWSAAVTSRCTRGSARRVARTSTRCHGAGIAVNTWTCDDPQRMARADRMGHRRHLHQRARRRARGDRRSSRVRRTRDRRAAPRWADVELERRSSRRGSRRRAGRGTGVVVLDHERSRSVCTSRCSVGVTPPPRRAPARPPRIARDPHRRNVIATSRGRSVAAGRQVERPVAEVGVRVGVEHDREVAVVGIGRRSRTSTPEVRLLAVVPAQPCGQRGVDEQRMAEPALERAARAPPRARRRRRSRCRCGSRSSGR